MKKFNATVSVHVDEIPNDVLFIECAARIQSIAKSIQKTGGGVKMNPETAKRYSDMFLKIQQAIYETKKAKK